MLLFPNIIPGLHRIYIFFRSSDIMELGLEDDNLVIKGSNSTLVLNEEDLLEINYG